MNFKSLFFLIVGVVVIGGIFFVGMAAGGASATPVAEVGLQSRLTAVEPECFPASTADELMQCLKDNAPAESE